MERSGEGKTFCERETEENSMEQKGVQKIKSAETNRHQADAEENSAKRVISDTAAQIHICEKHFIALPHN